MGTTARGLRYPEPTTEARTLHTRIKELADDMNGVFTEHDTRLTGLESKTNAPNTALLTRGSTQYRYGRSAGVITHSPNDGVNRTISLHENQFFVHPDANYVQVSISQASHASGAGGSAGFWEPLVQFGTTGWQLVNGNRCYNHNNQNNALDMGFHVVGMFNAQSYRGMSGSIATNYVNDATSAGWTINGFCLWSVVSFT